MPRLYSFGEWTQGFINTRQAPYQLSYIPSLASLNYTMKNTSQKDKSPFFIPIILICNTKTAKSGLFQLDYQAVTPLPVFKAV